MSIWTLFVLAIGVSMDAFSVSICKGLATQTVRPKHMVLAGLWFGGFQALMPLIGYLVGNTFGHYIERYDHWIAFLLLAFLGGKMIVEAIKGEEEPACGSFAVKEMLLLAIATSIDALAVGVSLAILPDVRIGWAVTFIGITTFLFSAVGVKIGNVFGARYKRRAELAGGIILALVGLGIFLDHQFGITLETLLQGIKGWFSGI